MLRRWPTGRSVWLLREAEILRQAVLEDRELLSELTGFQTTQWLC